MSERQTRIDPRLAPHQAAFLRRVVSEFERGKRLQLLSPVGFGKSFAISATVVELLRQGLVQRVLLLTPAVLAAQWKLLAEQWDHAAVALDAPTFRLLQQDVQPDESWPPGWYVASIYFATREDVRAVLERQPWDLVVVDEAHRITGQREALVVALASMARSPAMFFALATGDRDVPSVAGRNVEVFDWTQIAEESSSKRDEARVERHRVSYRRTEQERELLTRVEFHARSVAGAAGTDLIRRAASSLAALDDALFQVAALGNEHAEELLRLAERVERDGKLDAVASLVAGARERQTLPVVVFTEYLQTLDYVSAALEDRGERCLRLHGGMQSDEHLAVLADLRTRGGVLVATSAATQGASLNFVRVVVHYDLPARPSAFAQREGRYVRFGRTEPCTVYLLEDEDRTLAMEELMLRMADKAHSIEAELGLDVDEFEDP